MRMLRPGLVTGLTLALTSSALANHGGDIGIFFDVDATQCRTSVACNAATRLYVYALPQGASSGGITGVEYKVDIGVNGSSDPGWTFFNEELAANIVSIGSAFTPPDPTNYFSNPRGINAAWPTCEIGDGYKVLIESVEIINLGCNTSELVLHIAAHDRPSNQAFICPLFTLCDGPVYTKYCLGRGSSSGFAYVNPSPGRGCTVNVATGTWGQVKEIYRP